MALDSFTIVLLVTRPDAPEQDDDAQAASQDAHLSHLADLHEAGRLIAAGPLRDPELRGIAIFACDPEEAERLLADDPAVVAGWFSLRILPWMAPRGAVSFAPVPFPRSAAEAVAQ